jgi:L-rhamnonate dehydratase
LRSCPHCFSTGVLVAASLHFAATLDRPTFLEFSVADFPLVGSLLAEPFRLVDNRLAVPTDSESSSWITS